MVGACASSRGWAVAFPAGGGPSAASGGSLVAPALQGPTLLRPAAVQVGGAATRQSPRPVLLAASTLAPARPTAAATAKSAPDNLAAPEAPPRLPGPRSAAPAPPSSAPAGALPATPSAGSLGIAAASVGAAKEAAEPKEQARAVLDLIYGRVCERAVAPLHVETQDGMSAQLPEAGQDPAILEAFLLQAIAQLVRDNATLRSSIAKEKAQPRKTRPCKARPLVVMDSLQEEDEEAAGSPAAKSPQAMHFTSGSASSSGLTPSQRHREPIIDSSSVTSSSSGLAPLQRTADLSSSSGLAQGSLEPGANITSSRSPSQRPLEPIADSSPKWPSSPQSGPSRVPSPNQQKRDLNLNGSPRSPGPRPDLRASPGCMGACFTFLWGALRRR